MIPDNERSEVEKWVIVGEISKDGNALTEQMPSLTYLTLRIFPPNIPYYKIGIY